MGDYLTSNEFEATLNEQRTRRATCDVASATLTHGQDISRQNISSKWRNGNTGVVTMPYSVMVGDQGPWPGGTPHPIASGYCPDFPRLGNLEQTGGGRGCDMAGAFWVVEQDCAGDAVTLPHKLSDSSRCGGVITGAGVTDRWVPAWWMKPSWASAAGGGWQGLPIAPPVGGAVPDRGRLVTVPST